MTWLLTSTGREHLLGGLAVFSPSNVPSLQEIAHSLAHINRYTGHACRAYSVLEHSLLVADMIHADQHPPIAELCGLMHDAHESVCGDVASPIKQILGQTWRDFEDAQELALLQGYGLAQAMEEHAQVVKHYDLKALATERRDLLPYHASVHMPWPVIDTPGSEIQPWTQAALMAPSCVLRTPREWAQRWIKRTETLLHTAKGATP